LPVAYDATGDVGATWSSEGFRPPRSELMAWSWWSSHVGAAPSRFQMHVVVNVDGRDLRESNLDFDRATVFEAAMQRLAQLASDNVEILHCANERVWPSFLPPAAVGDPDLGGGRLDGDLPLVELLQERGSGSPGVGPRRRCRRWSPVWSRSRSVRWWRGWRCRCSSSRYRPARFNPSDVPSAGQVGLGRGQHRRQLGGVVGGVGHLRGDDDLLTGDRGPDRLPGGAGLASHGGAGKRVSFGAGQARP